MTADDARVEVRASDVGLGALPVVAGRPVAALTPKADGAIVPMKFFAAPAVGAFVLGAMPAHAG